MRLRLGWSSLLPMLLAAEPAPAEEAEAPTSLSLATRRQLAPGSALHHAADDYADCMEYATCRSEGFHCYKRAGMPYAQCRPETGTHCVEAGLWDPTVHSVREWLCPGWEYCAASHGNCASQHTLFARNRG